MTKTFTKCDLFYKLKTKYTVIETLQLSSILGTIGERLILHQNHPMSNSSNSTNEISLKVNPTSKLKDRTRKLQGPISLAKNLQKRALPSSCRRLGPVGLAAAAAGVTNHRHLNPITSRVSLSCLWIRRLHRPQQSKNRYFFQTQLTV